MPAIPIVVGALATYGAAAGTAALLAGTLTLATVAAGATMLGGVLMIAGGLKGGAEGNKWAGQGSILATVGSLGMAMTGPVAPPAEGAPSNAVATQADLTATGVDPGAASASASTPGASAATPASEIPGTTQAAANTSQDTVGNLISSNASPAASGSGVINTSANPLMTSPTAPTGAIVNASGTGVVAPSATAAETAATTTPTIPSTIQPPNTSLTSPNSVAMIAGQAMAGYNQGQVTQAQIDAAAALQQNQINANVQRLNSIQYNPLFTASNK